MQYVLYIVFVFQYYSAQLFRCNKQYNSCDKSTVNGRRQTRANIVLYGYSTNLENTRFILFTFITNYYESIIPRDA